MFYKGCKMYLILCVKLHVLPWASLRIISSPKFYNFMLQSYLLCCEVCAQSVQRNKTNTHIKGSTDSVESVVSRCCYALEAFCENLGGDIVTYLPVFMERMGEVMRRTTVETQEVAVSAISSVAVASGKLFESYFPAVYELMRGAMTQTGLFRRVFLRYFNPHSFLQWQENQTQIKS